MLKAAYGQVNTVYKLLASQADPAKYETPVPREGTLPSKAI